MERLIEMEKDIIEEKARRLLKEQGSDPITFDIVALAQSLGFEVFTSDLDDWDDGYIIANEFGQPIPGASSSKVIVVNRTRDAKFKRFVVAHELGHYKLKSGSDSIFAHRESKSAVKTENEQEVDYFAAALLMSKDEFVTAFNRLRAEGKSIAECTVELSNLFRAPMESVLSRLEELNLLPEAA